MARMVEEARKLGSTAIIGMRFDSGAIGQWSEICAYGTGVTVHPVSDYAKQQYEFMMQTGAMPQQDTYSTAHQRVGRPRRRGTDSTTGQLTRSDRDPDVLQLRPQPVDLETSPSHRRRRPPARHGPRASVPVGTGPSRSSRSSS